MSNSAFPAWINDNSPIPDPFGYGQEAVDFIRALKHPASTAPKSRFQLYDFQERMTRRIYGPRNPDGSRIVRTVFLMLPRGNRKTSIAAAWALLHTIGPEARPAGQAIFAASDREQAGIGFKEAANIVREDHRLVAATRIYDAHNSAKKIACRLNKAELLAVSSDGAAQHGKTPSFVLVDEIHAWKGRDLWEALKSGMAKVPDTLMIIATTAGRGQEAKDRLADLQLEKIAFPGDAAIDLNIDRQTALIEELTGEALRLRDILDRRNGYSENFIYRTGEEARGAKPPLDNLNNALSGTDTAAGRAVANIKNFGDAIRALKNEVPELAKSLADLDKKAQIEAVYEAAIARAQGQREIALANEMRGRALASANLKSATDDPTAYLSSVLASGKAQSHIDGMATAFASKLAKMIASMPDNLKGSVTINSGFRSVERQQELWLDALRKYGSPEAARKWVAPPGNSQHNKGNAADLGYSSDAARQWVHRNAGNFGLSFPLSNENWHIEDADARNEETAAEIDRLTEAATRQADAYSQITQGARQYTDAQRLEQQALGMTGQQAAALRYEQEMLNEAARAGIQLSPQQRTEIAQLAQGMAHAEMATGRLREKQEGLAEAGHFFGQQMTDALAGLLSGTMTAEQALQSMLQTLIKVGLQAVLMGEGPLAGLFGGGGNSSGGGFGGLFGMLLGGLFGFSEGGWTGPGSKYQPAGVVHADEYVFSKKATRALGVKNLDAMHEAAKRGYAEGGLVTGTPTLAVPDLGGVFAAPVQAISISAPVTVNGSAGTPEQNADLAKRMARQLEGTMRGVVADELRRQTRPGNFANSRSR
ncbi:terminase large subunit domain-containing protein [Neorhizobium alkalisoli]|uniref:terminase large subunit domain-containing protein n=1 Tax=Neorhizobium alkalisoli TaxID=528178 RepID=UPI000CF96BD6|nr:terminase large subunit [Neorhizobium alkalisoli]